MARPAACTVPRAAPMRTAMRLLAGASLVATLAASTNSGAPLHARVCRAAPAHPSSRAFQPPRLCRYSPRPPAPPMRGLDSAGLEGRESGGAWPTIGPRRPGAPRSVTALRAQAESWEECVKEALDVVLQPVDIKVRPCRPCLPAVGRLLRGLGLSLEDLSRDWS